MLISQPPAAEYCLCYELAPLRPPAFHEYHPSRMLIIDGHTLGVLSDAIKTLKERGNTIEGLYCDGLWDEKSDFAREARKEARYKTRKAAQKVRKEARRKARRELEASQATEMVASEGNIRIVDGVLLEKLLMQMECVP